MKAKEFQQFSSFLYSPGVYLFRYNGKAQETIIPPGKFLFEVWGAEGGTYAEQTNANVTTGKGGYSRGLILISHSTRMFVYVGGRGGNGSRVDFAAGGFNGGGSVLSNRSGGGGGGTDIRLEKNDLHSRVIVAGGGGGLEYSEPDSYGGAGGGASGQDGYQLIHTTQIGGGASQVSCGIHRGSGESPDFGKGGSSITKDSGGGGGGWYGGGAGGIHGNGGGGSGYVFTQQTAKYYPNPLPPIQFLLTNATTQGNVQAGDGLCKITFLTAFFSHAYKQKVYLNHIYVKTFLYILLSTRM